MNEAKHTQEVASGVEALIERLRSEGVAAGEEQGKARLAAAEQQAKDMIDKAQKQADELLATARAEAERVRTGGEEALAIAMRDVILKLKARLAETVGEKVQQLIAHELDQETFLQQLILQVAGRATRDIELEKADEFVVKLPEKLIGLDELRQKPLELKEGGLSHFILSVASDVLREGVTFAQSGRVSSGITIYLKGQDVELDLSDERLAQVLLEHLQPRFRAILEGMVK